MGRGFGRVIVKSSPLMSYAIIVAVQRRTAVLLDLLFEVCPFFGAAWLAGGSEWVLLCELSDDSYVMRSVKSG